MPTRVQRTSHKGQEGLTGGECLVDVGAVGQVDEDGVHVLDVCDDDGQDWPGWTEALSYLDP